MSKVRDRPGSAPVHPSAFLGEENSDPVQKSSGSRACGCRRSRSPTSPHPWTGVLAPRDRNLPAPGPEQKGWLLVPTQSPSASFWLSYVFFFLSHPSLHQWVIFQKSLTRCELATYPPLNLSFSPLFSEAGRMAMEGSRERRKEPLVFLLLTP